MPVQTELQAEVVRVPELDEGERVAYSVAVCGYMTDVEAVKAGLKTVREPLGGGATPRDTFVTEFAGLLPWTWESVKITADGALATVLDAAGDGWPESTVITGARNRVIELVETGTGGFAEASVNRFVTPAAGADGVTEYEYCDETVEADGATHFAVHVPAVLHSLQSGPAPTAAAVFKTTYLVTFETTVTRVNVEVQIAGLAPMAAEAGAEDSPSTWLDPRDRDADRLVRRAAETLGEFCDLAGQWLLFADEKRKSGDDFFSTHGSDFVRALGSLAGDVLHRGVLIKTVGGKITDVQGPERMSLAERLVNARLDATALERYGGTLLSEIKANAEWASLKWLDEKDPIGSMARAADAFAGERLAAWYAEQIGTAGRRAAGRTEEFKIWWTRNSTRWGVRKLRDAGLDALRRADLIGETWNGLRNSLDSPTFSEQFATSVREFARSRLTGTFDQWDVRAVAPEPAAELVDAFVDWLGAGAEARARTLQPTEHAQRTDLTPEPHPIYLEFTAPAAGDNDDADASTAGAGVLIRWAHPNPAKPKGPWRLLTACDAVVGGSGSWHSVGAVPFVEQRGVLTCGFAYHGQNYFSSGEVDDDSLTEEYEGAESPDPIDAIPEVRAPSGAHPWALTVPLGFGLTYEPAAFRIPNSGVLPRVLQEPGRALRLAQTMTGDVPPNSIGRLRYLRRVAVSGPVIVAGDRLKKALEYARSVNLVAGEREWTLKTRSERDVDAPQFALLLAQPNTLAGAWRADTLEFEVRAPSCSGRTLRAWYTTDWLLAASGGDRWRQYLADTAAADRWWQTTNRPENEAEVLKARFDDPAVTALAYELYRYPHLGAASRADINVAQLDRPALPPAADPPGALGVFATTQARMHSVNVKIADTASLTVSGNDVNVAVTRGDVWELRISSACVNTVFAHDDPNADDPTNGRHRLQASMRTHGTDEWTDWVLHSPYRLVIEVGELPPAA
jgi:hypothetical protein